MDLAGTSIGSYRVVKRIGAGGMGDVYELCHPTIGKRLAAKVLHREFAARDEIAVRFFDEARAANLIGHPGITDVLDHGILDDGRPYLLMELLDGESVAELIARRGALPLGEIAEILGGALSALAVTHERGIIHRDLKPDNLFRCRQGRVVVLDFGIAKLSTAIRSGQIPTRTGDLLGTPRYMAPEQASGRSREVDARTDVYALGATLYEMLTGRPPFAGQTLAALIEEQVQTSPRPPGELRRSLPEAWNAIVLRAMAKEPAERYASAGEMAAAIASAPTGDSPARRGPFEATELATPVARASEPAPAETLPTRPAGMPLGRAAADAAPTMVERNTPLLPSALRTPTPALPQRGRENAAPRGREDAAPRGRENRARPGSTPLAMTLLGVALALTVLALLFVFD